MAPPEWVHGFAFSWEPHFHPLESVQPKNEAPGYARKSNPGKRFIAGQCQTAERKGWTIGAIVGPKKRVLHPLIFLPGVQMSGRNFPITQQHQKPIQGGRMANGNNQLAPRGGSFIQQSNRPQSSGTMKLDAFGNQELAAGTENNMTASRAREEALINAKFMAARARPRDWDDVRLKLVALCRAFKFADAAIYAKPIGGKKQEGLSIRFAEAAARIMTNIDIHVGATGENAYKRIMNITVMDLESLLSTGRDITIEKTVERKTVRDGDIVLSQRENSYGETTYLIAANEDQLFAKESNILSKIRRNLILQILPGDIQDECKAVCYATLEEGMKADPGGEKKKLLEAFAGIGVTASMLKDYMQRPNLDGLRPKDLVELRTLYAAMDKEHLSWAEVYQDKFNREPDEVSAPDAEVVQQQAAPSPAPAPDIVDPQTGEVVSQGQPATDGGTPPEDPVENFKWRCERATDDQVKALIDEARERKAEWGDRADEISRAVAARRKRGAK